MLKNIFATVALFLFVGLAIAPNMAMVADYNFNPFGLIEPDGGGPDIFVRH